MTLRKELDDVLLEIDRDRKLNRRKYNKIRMKNTEEWAKLYGKRKKPVWSNQFSSYHERVVLVLRGYYNSVGFATRVKKIKTKKGTKYTLQLYDTVARRLR